MGVGVGPHNINDGLVFGYDTGYGIANNTTLTRFYPGIPAVNCAPGVAPTTGVSDGAWTTTEITDGSITPPRKGARVFKLVAGSTSNLYRQSNYYGGGGFSSNNPQNALILGRTSPSNYSTTSTAGKYQYGFWVRGDESNSSSWDIGIDKGDKAVTSYTVGNNTDWYFISASDQGNNSNSYPYDFFDMFSNDSGLVIYISDFGIYRAPGTVDSLPDLQAFPTFVDYGGTRSYTDSLIDLARDTSIDLTNVSFDSTGQLTFDGTDDYVDLSSDITISPNNQGWTAEYVFNTNSASTLQHFNSAEADDFNANWLALYNSKLAVWDHGQGTWRYGDTVFSSNTWYHIAFVQTSSTAMQFYVNGEAEGGDHTTFSWSANYSALKTRYIGRYEYNGGYGRYFNGEIPVVKMYNRAISAQEVLQNFNSYKNRFDI